MIKYFNYTEQMVSVIQHNGLRVSGILQAHNNLGSTTAPESIDLLTKRVGEIKGRRNVHKHVDFVSQRVYVQNIKTSTITTATPDELKDVTAGLEIKEAKNGKRLIDELPD